MGRPLTIFGGGLAGLTLGIGLRARDIPVTVYEAGRYPRHRVCGEFISGRGLATLQRLGLSRLLRDAGAVEALTAAFFSTTRSSGPRPLPTPAVCLSRHALDAALAQRFRELGGQLIEARRGPGEIPGEGRILATGRRPPGNAREARWFGLKAHARNVSLAADLEMHFSPQGYVGLCQINGGEVNVCGLFRKRPAPNPEIQKSRDLLRGQPGSLLHQRLASAEFDPNSFCAVAGLSLLPQKAAERTDFCLGDAVTMIPPVTGNGMSMAFESAEAALDPVSQWSRGEVSWGAARESFTRNCDSLFARRLRWAQWLQTLALLPGLQSPLIGLIARSDGLFRRAFERTR